MRNGASIRSVYSTVSGRKMVQYSTYSLLPSIIKDRVIPSKLQRQRCTVILVDRLYVCVKVKVNGFINGGDETVDVCMMAPN